MSMLAARSEAVKRLRKKYPSVEEGHLLSKLIAYCSREAHSCVEKDAMIAFVKIRILGADKNGSLNANSLIEAMEEDTNDGLMPFFVSTTLGTTGSCSFDNLEEIGSALKKFPDVWLHVDAAYAGSAFICPELRQYLNVSFLMHNIIEFALVKSNNVLGLLKKRESNMLIQLIQILINGY